MNNSANITYNGVADKNARTAFEQASSEITALKKGVADLSDRLSGTFGGASGASGVDASVTAWEASEGVGGTMMVTLAFAVTLDGSTGYAAFMTLAKGFPKSAVSGSVAFSAAPPAAGSVTCSVLPDGRVMIGKNGTGGAFDCIATAVWRRR